MEQILLELPHVHDSAVVIIAGAIALVAVLQEIPLIHDAPLGIIQSAIPGDAALLHLALIGQIAGFPQDADLLLRKAQQDGIIRIGLHPLRLAGGQDGMDAEQIVEAQHAHYHHQGDGQAPADEPAKSFIVVLLVPGPDIQKRGKEVPDL